MKKKKNEKNIKIEATTQPDQKGHIVICTIDFDGDEGQLSFKTNDEIEVLRKEGDSWFGRLVKDGKEGYFHHLAVIVNSFILFIYFSKNN